MKVLYKVNDLGYDQCMNKKEESKKTSMELAYLRAVETLKLHRKLDEALKQGHEVILTVVESKSVIEPKPLTKKSIVEKRIDLHPSTINYRTTCSYDEVHLPEDVAMYLDCLPDEPFTTEDEYYLYNCIIEELPQARYADGTVYQSELVAIARSFDLPERWHTTHQAFLRSFQSRRAYRHRIARKDY